MPISVVYWGARQSGKTTALFNWAWKKRAVWFFPDYYRVKQFKKAYPQFLATNKLDELRGAMDVVVDDFDALYIADMFDILIYPLNLAIAFTPPPTKNAVENYTLKQLTLNPRAQKFTGFYTEQQLGEIRQQVPADIFKSQYLGEFLTDDV